MANEPIIINASELANSLGVRTTLIRRWAKEKKIPSIVLPSGRKRFDLLAVVSVLKKTEPKDIETKRMLLTYESLKKLHNVTDKSKRT